MKPVFVTGTDTGIGKTLVTCALSAFCSLRKGLDVGVMKPLEAGPTVHGSNLLPGDAIRLKEASGSQDNLSLINPYCFESPLAPETASELEHLPIDLELLDGIYKQLKAGHDILYLEGAGGILVPIARNFFYVDLMKRWETRALVVARLGLGTINHTLLTCRYLTQAGIPIVGVILNDNDGSRDLAARTNPEMLARYLEAPLLGVFPHIEPKPQGMPDRAFLARLAEKYIDTAPILDSRL